MKQILLVLFACIITGAQVSEAQKLTVGSFNIRYANPSDSLHGNGWKQRYPVIRDLIRFHDFEIFGAQEVLHNQLLELLAGLPGYNHIGVGRDDGKILGEYAPIFYQEKKFKVLKSGYFWLSDTTDRPNRGWDAALPRICTWAKFKDLRSGLKFFFFNLHMDHIGVQARKNSTILVLQKIAEICDGKPVILAGDFNADQNSTEYAMLRDSPLLDDAYEVAGIQYALNGTFNNFRPDQRNDSRIDHVFVSTFFNVDRYGILTDTYRTEIQNNPMETIGNLPQEVSLTTYASRTPSDHFPVKVVVSFKR